MKRYEIGQGGIEGLRMTEQDVPRPGPGQVLVRMRAASLNYRDLLVIGGRYGRLRPGLVPLSDGAGDVVEIGPGVTRVAAGDRVAAIFAQGWIGGEQDVAARSTALGGALDGVLSQYCVFGEQGLVKLPDHLDHLEGATLPCAAVTAWNALYGLRPLRVGDTVLTLGTGGVSLFAAQFSRAAGARVIMTTSSDAKIDRARAAGAAEIINYRASPDWNEEVMRLTGGRGVDSVIEVGGAGTLSKSVASTRTGGVVTMIGLLSEGAGFDPMTVLQRSVILRGIVVGSRQMFEEMNRAICAHHLQPIIDSVFEFEDAADAFRRLRDATHAGKIVIRID